MPVFEHVKTITFGAEGGELHGCQRVTIEGNSEEIEHSECESNEITYRGTHGKHFSGTVELAGVSLARDVGGMAFGGTIFEAIGAEIAETGEDDMHEADGECWISHISVRKRSVEVRLTARDISAIAAKVLGMVGTVSVSFLTGTLAEGCTDTSVGITVEKCMVVGVSIEAAHNEFAEGTLTLKGTGIRTGVGSAKVDGGPALEAIHTGMVGGLSWIVPSATAGGSDKAFSLSNCIVTGKRIVFEQGAMLRESFTFKSYSEDGVTSPFSG